MGKKSIYCFTIIAKDKRTKQVHTYTHNFKDLNKAFLYKKYFEELVGEEAKINSNCTII